MLGSRPIVSLSDVSLVLDGKKVLDHIDWAVSRGENWVVLGPNGAGKTSLLSMINGYRWPSSGKVSVMGKTFGSADLRELRTMTGLVSNFLDGMIDRQEKVVELVLSGKFGSTRVLRKVERGDVERATSLLEGLGCASLRDKSLSELSQGERQKVAIARAMMAKPELLVLDEPCEGLDIASRESFLDGLASLLERGGETFIEVVHRTEDIPPGFTHALLLRKGHAIASGRIERVLTSGNLSRCFGTRVELNTLGGRYYMIPKSRAKPTT